MLKQMLQRHGITYTEITPEILRKLIICQNWSCALSGIRLALPSTTVLPFGTCLNAWRKTIKESDPHDYYSSPDLVRANSRNPWEPGNVILISHAYYDLYKASGSINTVKERCAAIVGANVVVSQLETILKTLTPDEKEALDREEAKKAAAAHKAKQESKRTIVTLREKAGEKVIPELAEIVPSIVPLENV